MEPITATTVIVNAIKATPSVIASPLTKNALGQINRKLDETIARHKEALSKIERKIDKITARQGEIIVM